MSEDNPVTVNPVQPEKSIVILYENNVHCGIDGYAKMRGLRDAIVRADTSYVALVNAGDVVVLSHLGETEPHTGINSHKLVESTRGIDVVLDGHTHSVIPCDLVANLDNVLVPTTQTGTKFNNVGKLWISPEGKFVTTLVAKEDIPYTNDAITATTDSIKKLMKNVTIEKMATTDFDLPDMEGSTWLVRHQETTIGNLISDAFRTIFDCQIGLINGGAPECHIHAPYDRLLL